MTWDDRDVRLNLRDETMTAVLERAETDPLTEADHALDDWAASGQSFGSYVAAKFPPLTAAQRDAVLAAFGGFTGGASE